MKRSEVFSLISHAWFGLLWIGIISNALNFIEGPANRELLILAMAVQPVSATLCLVFLVKSLRAEKKERLPEPAIKFAVHPYSRPHIPHPRKGGEG